MLDRLIYSLISIFFVSLISLIGIFFVSLKTEKLRKILIYLISFAAGSLFADAFLHLIPKAAEQFSNATYPLIILGGILLFFFLEKVVLWNHCHMPITKTHVHSFAFMNLIGDGLHNILDGLIITASYIISIPAGIATSLAVLFHEIPQEIGDFGILIHGGIKPKKAILLNFLIALTAFIGAIFGFLMFSWIDKIESVILLIAAGGFIYIAGSDLIPELHKQNKIKTSLLQIASFVLGVLIIFALLFLE